MHLVPCLQRADAAAVLHHSRFCGRCCCLFCLFGILGPALEKARHRCPCCECLEGSKLGSVCASATSLKSQHVPRGQQSLRILLTTKRRQFCVSFGSFVCPFQQPGSPCQLLAEATRRRDPAMRGTQRAPCSSKVQVQLRIMKRHVDHDIMKSKPGCIGRNANIGSGYLKGRM